MLARPRRLTWKRLAVTEVSSDLQNERELSMGHLASFLSEDSCALPSAVFSAAENHLANLIEAVCFPTQKEHLLIVAVSMLP